MMNYMTDPTELLKAHELTAQVIRNSSILPWVTPVLLRTLEDQNDDMVKRLEKLTRPNYKSLAELFKARGITPGIARPIPSKIGFEYGGEFIPCSSCLDIWRKLLKSLWKDHPDRRIAMAASARRCGYNRSYISDSREDLFTGKTDLWVRKHGRELCDGWYMDNTVTPERINKILPRVVTSIGLKWEVDVRVIWNYCALDQIVTSITN